MFKSEYIKRMLEAGNELEAIKHAEILACIMNSGLVHKKNWKPYKPGDFYTNYPKQELTLEELEKLWWAASQ